MMTKDCYHIQLIDLQKVHQSYFVTFATKLSHNFHSTEEFPPENIQSGYNFQIYLLFIYISRGYDNSLYSWISIFHSLK